MPPVFGDLDRRAIATVIEPLLVLDANSALSLSMLRFAAPLESLLQKTEGRLISELGNYQWDIPQCRNFLPASYPPIMNFKTSI
jgi:hypothetical protein